MKCKDDFNIKNFKNLININPLVYFLSTKLGFTKFFLFYIYLNKIIFIQQRSFVHATLPHPSKIS